MKECIDYFSEIWYNGWMTPNVTIPSAESVNEQEIVDNFKGLNNEHVNRIAQDLRSGINTILHAENINIMEKSRLDSKVIMAFKPGGSVFSHKPISEITDLAYLTPTKLKDAVTFLIENTEKEVSLKIVEVLKGSMHNASQIDTQGVAPAAVPPKTLQADDTSLKQQKSWYNPMRYFDSINATAHETISTPPDKAIVSTQMKKGLEIAVPATLVGVTGAFFLPGLGIVSAVIAAPLLYMGAKKIIQKNGGIKLSSQKMLHKLWGIKRWGFDSLDIFSENFWMKKGSTKK